MAELSADDQRFMQIALDEAAAAARRGEVPIGAVVVDGANVLSRAGNQTILDCDPTAHAEIVALRAAARAAANHRLTGVTLFVTVEPCAMCAGALIQARIGRLVYGADDPKGGAVRSCFQMLEHPALNHSVPWAAGLLAVESASLLQQFFAARR